MLSKVGITSHEILTIDVFQDFLQASIPSKVIRPRKSLLHFFKVGWFVLLILTLVFLKNQLPKYIIHVLKNLTADA